MWLIKIMKYINTRMKYIFIDTCANRENFIYFSKGKYFQDKGIFTK